MKANASYPPFWLLWLALSTLAAAAALMAVAPRAGAGQRPAAAAARTAAVDRNAHFGQWPAPAPGATSDDPPAPTF
jgi:hypothetical protein